MASSGSGSVSASSDESSKAPENFRVSSTSNDDDEICAGVVSAALARKINNDIDDESEGTPTLRCPLCCTQQWRFHCRNCVKNGNVAHSTEPYGECLNEKQQKYLSTQAALHSLNKRFDQLFVKEQKSEENIRFQIKRKREKLALLNQLIEEKRAKLQTCATQCDELRKANAEKRLKLPMYPIKVKELEEYVLDRIEKIGKLRERHRQLLGRLQASTRRNIHQLVQYIFPIREVVLRDEQRQSHVEATAQSGLQSAFESETIAALADAKNTSYIRGKWVFHGSGISEMQYRIVAPSLPANGDYTAYIDWLTDNKDDVPKTTANEITPSRVTAFRIVGALTYTCQLTQLLSYYLNVRLPHKLAYGDFCKKLNEEQFLRKVSRLNANILYLAYTQQVKLRALNEQHTLENLLAILDVDKSDLGRYGFHDVGNAPLMKSVDSLLIGIEMTESESEDENSLRLDWEAVPNLPASQQHEIINSNLMLPAAAQQSTIAEGLMTSAANRITSIWRWMK